MSLYIKLFTFIRVLWILSVNMMLFVVDKCQKGSADAYGFP